MTEEVHTKDQLAAALRELGLEEMAKRAAEGVYHDFLSPYPLPEMELVRDLQLESTKLDDSSVENKAKRIAIMALRRRVINGDFDASKKESDEWAKSAEGQAAFRSLIKTEKKPN